MTHQTTQPLLSLRHVQAQIGDTVPLLDVSLEVLPGRTLGLVGESGSGKSLTLRVALGMLDRIGGQVTGGTVSLDGRDLLALSPKEWLAVRGSQVGFVPQNSSVLLNPVRRIGTQLKETVRRLDPKAPTTTRAMELLDAVRIPRPESVMRLYPHEVSGGMLQRVMIALALAGRPTLLVADEPTTALDVTVQKSVLELLTELKRELNMSMIFVSHDLDVIEAISDDITVMYAGTSVESGPVLSVAREAHHPYTRALIAARPGPNVDSTGIPGSAPSLDARPTGCQFEPRCPRATNECREALVPLLTERTPWPVACVHAGERALR